MCPGRREGSHTIFSSCFLVCSCPHSDTYFPLRSLCKTFPHQLNMFARLYFLLMDSLCVWGLFGRGGGGSHQELVWLDPLHCFHSKGCWVCSLHIHPSCQRMVCVERARPSVYSLSEPNPIRRRCVREGQGSARLGPASSA